MQNDTGTMSVSPDARDLQLERDADRHRIDAMAQQCDRLAAELSVARDRMERTQFELVRARATIANMERSWFWRVRLFWVRLRRTLGGRGD